ncbi:MAG: hypothetical protein J6S76_07850 [Clostridia bacterium]|nr:hypothetical protein [Clostridia bacterium]
MKRSTKARIKRWSVLPLCLLICVGMYFCAHALAQHIFSNTAAEAGGAGTADVREGLWCYNSLNAREQQVYEAIEWAADGRRRTSRRVAFVPTEEEFIRAVQALSADRPEYCDVLWQESRMEAGAYSACVRLTYMEDDAQRRKAMREAARVLLAGVRTEGGWDCARGLHDALVSRVTYSAQDGDTVSAVGSTAYDALVLGLSDSTGYAAAYTYLCREAGISCMTVTGMATDGTAEFRHAWNALMPEDVPGYTDVMWNDAAAIELPFHGYYFLSLEEMGADHTPDGYLQLSGGDTNHFYEREGCFADTEEEIPALLVRILTEARREGTYWAELCIPREVGLPDYALEEYLNEAIAAVNADEAQSDLPKLRTVNRIYHASVAGGGMTVQLFYENRSEETE